MHLVLKPHRANQPVPQTKGVTELENDHSSCICELGDTQFKKSKRSMTIEVVPSGSTRKKKLALIANCGAPSWPRQSAFLHIE